MSTKECCNEDRECRKNKINRTEALLGIVKIFFNTILVAAVFIGGFFVSEENKTHLKKLQTLAEEGLDRTNKIILEKFETAESEFVELKSAVMLSLNYNEGNDVPDSYNDIQFRFGNLMESKVNRLARNNAKKKKGSHAPYTNPIFTACGESVEDDLRLGKCTEEDMEEVKIVLCGNTSGRHASKQGKKISAPALRDEPMHLEVVLQGATSLYGIIESTSRSGTHNCAVPKDFSWADMDEWDRQTLCMCVSIAGAEAAKVVSDLGLKLDVLDGYEESILERAHHMFRMIISIKSQLLQLDSPAPEAPVIKHVSI